MSTETEMRVCVIFILLCVRLTVSETWNETCVGHLGNSWAHNRRQGEARLVRHGASMVKLCGPILEGPFGNRVHL